MDIWDLLPENGQQHQRVSGILKAMLTKQFGRDGLAERLGGIEARRGYTTVSMGTFEGIIHFSERPGKVELLCLPSRRIACHCVEFTGQGVHNA